MAFTAQEIKDYIEAVQYDPVAIAQTAGKFNVSMDDIASAMGYDTGQVIDYLKTGLQKVGMEVYFDGGEQQGEAGSTYTPMTINSFSRPVEGSKRKYEAFGADMQSRGIIDNGSLTSQILSDLSPVITMAVPFAGAELASLLGVSTATGTALVNAGMQVAQGGDAKSVLTGLVSSQLSQAVSPMVASELQGLVSDPTTSKLITNIGTSVVNNVLNGNTSNLGKTILGSAVDTLVGDQTGNSTLGNVVGSAVTGGGQGAANTLAGIVGSSGSTAPTIDTYPETSDDLISILAGKPDNSSITAPTDTQSLLDILGDKSSQIIDDAPFVAAPETQVTTQRTPTDYSKRSFNSAFAAARALGEPDFTWKGQTFTTELAPKLNAGPASDRTINTGPGMDPAKFANWGGSKIDPNLMKTAAPNLGWDPSTYFPKIDVRMADPTSALGNVPETGYRKNQQTYLNIAPYLTKLEAKSPGVTADVLSHELAHVGQVLSSKPGEDISKLYLRMAHQAGLSTADIFNRPSDVTKFNQALNAAIPHISNTYGTNAGTYLGNPKAPMFEKLTDLAAIEMQTGKDLTKDPVLQNTLFKDPKVGAMYNTMTIPRMTRLDPRDLPTGTVTSSDFPKGETPWGMRFRNMLPPPTKSWIQPYAAGGLAGGGLTQSQAQALETAYAAGDISTVNQLLSSGISAADVKNFWGFTDADIAGLSGLGVKFNQPVTTNDEVLNVVNQSTNVTNNTANTAAKTNTISDKPTAAELQALYLQNGVYTPTTITTEQGDQVVYNPITYNNGLSLWENPGAIIGYQGQGQDATPITGAASLGGYSKKDGDFVNFYDTTGKLVAREKWNKGDWETIWDDLGPVISAAATGYLGTIPLGTTGLTAANALNAARALDSGNVMGLISNTVGALPGNTFNVAGYTAQDALNVAKFTNAALNKDIGGVVTSIGSLTGSSDLKLAGAAATVLAAANSGNDKQLFDAVTGLTRILNAGSTTGSTTGTTTTTAGTDTTLPTGVQLASTGTGVFKTDVGGVPTYAESSNASTVKTPLGYTLLSMAESDDKPPGSYYDITANAWFKPSTELTDLSGNANIQADAALFNNSLGTLDKLDSTRSADDFASFLATIGITNPTQLADSGLSNQDILDLINASTLGGTTGLDGTGGTGTTGTGTGGTGPGGTGPGGTGPGGTADCGPGFHDDGTGFCVPDDDEIICPPGKVLNEEGTACIDETVIVAPRNPCPPGTKYDEDLDACMPITTECAPGFHDDGTGLCVPDDEKCSDGYHLENGTCVPDDCPEGYVRDLETGQCVPADEPCQAGYHRNASGVCVPDETEPCKDGYHRNEAGVCVPDDDKPCADGFHRDEATGLCVPDDDEECKDGYEKVNGVCEPVCKDGYIRNLETGICEKADTSCPAGQTKNADGKCVPIVVPPTNCQPGYEKVNGVCVPMCQPGYRRVNGVCKKITTDITVPTSALGASGEKTDPIYAGGMDEFNLLATLQELLKDEPAKKADNKSTDKTKMATGGHLDDLLAEQMTVDDLLKLLR